MPDPDRMASLTATEDAFIESHGFFYHLVFGDHDNPGFIYTSGLSEKKSPDLIFVGSSNANSTGYLRNVVDHLLSGRTIEPGGIEPETDLNPYLVPMFVMDAQAKLLTHAFGVSSRLKRIGSTLPPRLMQIVMPDFSSRFPWEDGYDWVDQMVDPEQTAFLPGRTH